jgi:hypothetical protein
LPALNKVHKNNQSIQIHYEDGNYNVCRNTG